MENVKQQFRAQNLGGKFHLQLCDALRLHCECKQLAHAGCKRQQLRARLNFAAELAEKSKLGVRFSRGSLIRERRVT